MEQKEGCVVVREREGREGLMVTMKGTHESHVVIACFRKGGWY